MGRKSDLKPEEKKKITQLLNQGKTSLDISKIIHRDHRTVKVLQTAARCGRGQIRARFERFLAGKSVP